MAKNLVIVESPTKAKTIERFLGKDYKIMSSYGHIRDLHRKDFSIAIDKDFSPIYEIPTEKAEVVRQLTKESEKADIVWLASDEDREGEAIAWHLYEVLKLKPERTKRIVFHEITKQAILKAIENPREIDTNLVDAQQARRVLDRIVGFELSPVLWKKIKPGLSAGRVQSVAVKLIVEREKEIESFKSESFYRVTAQLQTADGTVLAAEVPSRFKSEATAREFLEACATATLTVADISVKPVKRSPAPPFTTSTLQQEASRKLGMSVSQTMTVAQRLYESGLITYMRTDSFNLSTLALGAIAGEIKGSMGEQYLKLRKYHTNTKGAQEAHEAIRPTYINKVSIEGNAQEKRLYNLIWNRAVASQMADAIIERTTVEVEVSGRKEKFNAVGEVVKFDGFMRLYTKDDEEKNNTAALPVLAKGAQLSIGSATATESFTQQPARYTEATLVKKLEELGIGRPSTYAPTITTIQNREYVAKGEKKGATRSYKILTLKGGKITEKEKSETTGSDKGKLIPTDTGVVVTDFLQEYFPKIMDYNFTAQVEEEFDGIAEGGIKWNESIGRFYTHFHPEVSEVSNLRLEHKVGERILGKDPKTGRSVSVKIGRFGPVAQIGSSEDAEKPIFAPLQKGQSVATITFEEALKLFELPRTLGQFEGSDVTVAVGRFGPYIKHAGKYASIPGSISPMAITLEEATELLIKKREDDAKKLIKKFDQEPDLQVLNGRFGPYIAYKKSNYKIPKGTDATALTLDDCMKIVAQAEQTPKKSKPRGRRAASKKQA